MKSLHAHHDNGRIIVHEFLGVDSSKRAAFRKVNEYNNLAHLISDPRLRGSSVVLHEEQCMTTDCFGKPVESGGNYYVATSKGWLVADAENLFTHRVDESAAIRGDEFEAVREFAGDGVVVPVDRVDEFLASASDQVAEHWLTCITKENKPLQSPVSHEGEVIGCVEWISDDRGDGTRELHTRVTGNRSALVEKLLLSGMFKRAKRLPDQWRHRKYKDGMKGMTGAAYMKRVKQDEGVDEKELSKDPNPRIKPEDKENAGIPADVAILAQPTSPEYKQILDRYLHGAPLTNLEISLLNTPPGAHEAEEEPDYGLERILRADRESHRVDPSHRFVAIKNVSGLRGQWEVDSTTNDVVAHKAARPHSYGLKYFDKQNKMWVRPGKRGPLKDQNSRPQYGEVPTDPEEELGNHPWHTKSIEDVKKDFVTSDDAYTGFDKGEHEKAIRGAVAFGKEIPAHVKQSFPHLFSANEAEDHPPMLPREPKYLPVGHGAFTADDPEGAMKYHQAVNSAYTVHADGNTLCHRCQKTQAKGTKIVRKPGSLKAWCVDCWNGRGSPKTVGEAGQSSRAEVQLLDERWPTAYQAMSADDKNRYSQGQKNYKALSPEEKAAYQRDWKAAQEATKRSEKTPTPLSHVIAADQHFTASGSAPNRATAILHHQASASHRTRAANLSSLRADNKAQVKEQGHAHHEMIAKLHEERAKDHMESAQNGNASSSSSRRHKGAAKLHQAAARAHRLVHRLQGKKRKFMFTLLGVPKKANESVELDEADWFHTQWGGGSDAHVMRKDHGNYVVLHKSPQVHRLYYNSTVSKQTGLGDLLGTHASHDDAAEHAMSHHQDYVHRHRKPDWMESADLHEGWNSQRDFSTVRTVSHGYYIIRPDQVEGKSTLHYLPKVSNASGRTYADSKLIGSFDSEASAKHGAATHHRSVRAAQESAPPGFSGTVQAMKDGGMDPAKAFRLAWAGYKKGNKPHVPPEPGKPKYRPPEESVDEASGALTPEQHDAIARYHDQETLRYRDLMRSATTGAAQSEAYALSQLHDKARQAHEQAAHYQNLHRRGALLKKSPARFANDMSRAAREASRKADGGQAAAYESAERVA